MRYPHTAHVFREEVDDTAGFNEVSGVHHLFSARVSVQSIENIYGLEADGTALGRGRGRMFISVDKYKKRIRRDDVVQIDIGDKRQPFVVVDPGFLSGYVTIEATGDLVDKQDVQILNDSGNPVFTVNGETVVVTSNV